MMKPFTSWIIGLLMLCGGGMMAQDIHFSQFYSAPLDLNPALTGVMNCNIRLVANYRNQWASVLKSNAFATYSASYDQKIPVGRRDYFGVGGNFWGDKAGELNFSTIQARFSGSYSKYMGGDRSSSHYLVFGARAGIAQRRIDFLQARYGTQHDGNGDYCPQCPTQEDETGDNFLFGDVSAGLLWFSTFSESSSFYIGGAYSHMNNPNQSFFEDNVVELYSKYTLHAGGEFEVADNMSLVPGVVSFFQGPSFELNGGTSVRFDLSKSRFSKQTFQFGIWTRLVNNYVWGTTVNDQGEVVGFQEDTSIGADAIILSTRFDYDNWGIGFSYDVNVSTLKKASNSNGAFEFSLIYKICGPEQRGVYCPQF